MSRSFITSVASGYATVVVQAATGILLVPYLLSSHGVGLEGFGQIATVQALAAALGMLLDGHRQYSARQIALSATRQQPSRLPALLMVTAVTCIVLAAVSILLGPAIIGVAELRTDGAGVAWRLACGCFVVEQLCYLLDSQLHSARRSTLANALGAGDAVTRAILTVTLFALVQPAIHWFFLAALISLSTRLALLSWVCRKALLAPALAHLRDEARQVVRSLPLALNGVAPFLVFRLTIIVGNKSLGPEQVGVLSLVLVTARTYVNQAVLSAMRPILVARLAGDGWTNQPASARQSFLSRVRQYQFAVCALGAVLALGAPIWVPLWLGSRIEAYVPYFAVLLILFAAEVGHGIAYYWLVANGRAHRLAVWSGIVGALVSGAVMLAAASGASMFAYATAVVVYLVAYILGVRYEFRRWFGVGSGGTTPCRA